MSTNALSPLATRPAQTATSGLGLVRVDAHDLIALQPYAQRIPLNSGRIRALQVGNRRSPYKGRGMDYEESRRYQPGDDRRNLDWRVTARTGKPYTKLFREERERPVLLCVDFSSSMFFATRGAFKSVLATRAAALVAWAALAHGDRVGGLIFGGGHKIERRPTRGKHAVLGWVHDVCRTDLWSAPHRESDSDEFAVALLHARRVTRPGSLVCVFSDFRHFDEPHRAQLAQLAWHNEVILVCVYDPLERELPPPGRYPITDGVRRFALDTRRGGRRRRHRRQFDERIDALRFVAAQHRMAFALVATTDDPVGALHGALSMGS